MISVLTRRDLVFGTASMLMSADNSVAVSEAFDHLLLGISDLDHGIAWFEERAGVRAAMGGVHPGRGTRNALASLGGKHYLEIIAPDPAQTTVHPQFPIGNLTEPRLINFAVRTNDIKSTENALGKAGVITSGVKDGSRRMASGALLRWKTLSIESNFTEGAIDPIPFFIEWASDSIHPSTNAPAGCRIESLRFEHPRAEGLRAALQTIGLEATVGKSDHVRIVAVIQTLKGSVQLT